ncbi:hypothetical protein HK101_005461 [Irineochytrium annulatum]|nr:hypothetical protein HK101_005461 [Irineochytrium annulatum]
MGHNQQQHQQQQQHHHSRGGHHSAHLNHSRFYNPTSQHSSPRLAHGPHNHNLHSHYHPPPYAQGGSGGGPGPGDARGGDRERDGRDTRDSRGDRDRERPGDVRDAREIARERDPERVEYGNGLSSGGDRGDGRERDILRDRPPPPPPPISSHEPVGTFLSTGRDRENGGGGSNGSSGHRMDPTGRSGGYERPDRALDRLGGGRESNARWKEGGPGMSTGRPPPLSKRDDIGSGGGNSERPSPSMSSSVLNLQRGGDSFSNSPHSDTRDAGIRDRDSRDSRNRDRVDRDLDPRDARERGDRGDRSNHPFMLLDHGPGPSGRHLPRTGSNLGPANDDRPMLNASPTLSSSSHHHHPPPPPPLSMGASAFSDSLPPPQMMREQRDMRDRSSAGPPPPMPLPRGSYLGRGGPPPGDEAWNDDVAAGPRWHGDPKRDYDLRGEGWEPKNGSGFFRPPPQAPMGRRGSVPLNQGYPGYGGRGGGHGGNFEPRMWPPPGHPYAHPGPPRHDRLPRWGEGGKEPPGPERGRGPWMGPPSEREMPPLPSGPGSDGMRDHRPGVGPPPGGREWLEREREHVGREWAERERDGGRSVSFGGTGPPPPGPPMEGPMGPMGPNGPGLGRDRPVERYPDRERMRDDHIKPYPSHRGSMFDGAPRYAEGYGVRDRAGVRDADGRSPGQPPYDRKLSSASMSDMRMTSIPDAEIKAEAAVGAVRGKSVVDEAETWSQRRRRAPSTSDLPEQMQEAHARRGGPPETSPRNAIKGTEAVPMVASPRNRPSEPTRTRWAPEISQRNDETQADSAPRRTMPDSASRNRVVQPDAKRMQPFQESSPRISAIQADFGSTLPVQDGLPRDGAMDVESSDPVPMESMQEESSKEAISVLAEDTAPPTAIDLEFQPEPKALPVPAPTPEPTLAAPAPTLASEPAMKMTEAPLANVTKAPPLSIITPLKSVVEQCGLEAVRRLKVEPIVTKLEPEDLSLKDVKGEPEDDSANAMDVDGEGLSKEEEVPMTACSSEELLVVTPQSPSAEPFNDEMEDVRQPRPHIPSPVAALIRRSVTPKPIGTVTAAILGKASIVSSPLSPTSTATSSTNISPMRNKNAKAPLDLSVADRIVKENQQMARERSSSYLRELAYATHPLPLRIRRNVEDYDFYHDNIRRHAAIKPLLIKYIGARMKELHDKRVGLQNEWKEKYDVWKRNSEKLEGRQARKKKAVDNGPVLPAAVSAAAKLELQQQQEGLGKRAMLQQQTQSISGGRPTRRSNMANFTSDAVKSEAEWQEVLAMIAATESSGIASREALQASLCVVDPPMLIDPVEKKIWTFESTNQLVLDPVLELGRDNLKLEMKWNEQDREMFRVKMLQHGKNFPKIAAALKTKTTQDCVQYYYREKHALGFKQLLRKGGPGGGRGIKRKGPAITAPVKKSGGGKEPTLQKARASLLGRDGIVKTSNKGSEISLLGSGVGSDDDAEEDDGTGLRKKPRLEEKVAENSAKTRLARRQMREKQQQLQLQQQEQAAAQTDAPDQAADSALTNHVIEKTQPPTPNADAIARGMKDEAFGVPPTPLMDIIGGGGSGGGHASSWSMDEKSKALDAISRFGKDFVAVSQAVGTKTVDECREFHQQYSLKLKLDPGQDGAGGGGSKKKPKGPKSRNSAKSSAAPVEKKVGITRPRRGVRGEEPGDQEEMADEDAADGVVPMEGVDEQVRADGVQGDDSKKSKRKKAKRRPDTLAMGGMGISSEALPIMREEEVYAISNEHLSPSMKMLDGTSPPASRKTVSYWSKHEKDLFEKAIRSWGRDWEQISRYIVTKSAIQVRNHYHNAKSAFDEIIVAAGFSVHEEDPPISGDHEPGDHRMMMDPRSADMYRQPAMSIYGIPQAHAEPRRNPGVAMLLNSNEYEEGRYHGQAPHYNPQQGYVPQGGTKSPPVRHDRMPSYMQQPVMYSAPHPSSAPFQPIYARDPVPIHYSHPQEYPGASYSLTPYMDVMRGPQHPPQHPHTIHPQHQQPQNHPHAPQQHHPQQQQQQQQHAQHHHHQPQYQPHRPAQPSNPPPPPQQRVYAYQQHPPPQQQHQQQHQQHPQAPPQHHHPHPQQSARPMYAPVTYQPQVPPQQQQQGHPHVQQGPSPYPHDYTYQQQQAHRTPHAGGQPQSPRMPMAPPPGPAQQQQQQPQQPHGAHPLQGLPGSQPPSGGQPPPPRAITLPSIHNLIWQE